MKRLLLLAALPLGGRSDLVSPGVTGEGAQKALRLAGTVNTRGGGFIQASLGRERGVADLSEWQGVEVAVQAPAGGSYFLHVRTTGNLVPWSYYQAPLEATGDRVTLRIPWTSLAGVSVGSRKPDTRSVRSIALVAAFKDFEADLLIYRISLHP